jgi:hypothetical protein
MFICEKCINEHEPLKFPSWFYPQSYGPCELCHKTGFCIDHHGDLPPLKKELLKNPEMDKT